MSSRKVTDNMLNMVRRNGIVLGLANDIPIGEGRSKKRDKTSNIQPFNIGEYYVHHDWHNNQKVGNKGGGGALPSVWEIRM